MRLQSSGYVQCVFQFPLLGFLLCINVALDTTHKQTGYFQFPLLGFLLCIRVRMTANYPYPSSLSIPFIGIFALHRENVKWEQKCKSLFSFNSLYWDFCSASGFEDGLKMGYNISFNSLYWDFCSASSFKYYCLVRPRYFFQFPLLGFLLCINNVKKRNRNIFPRLSIPFIGIFALHLHLFLPPQF